LGRQWLDPVTVARMAGDKVETIMSTYAHELDAAKNRDGLRDKLDWNEHHTGVRFLRAVAAGFAFAFLGANTTLFVYVWPFFGLTEVAS